MMGVFQSNVFQNDVFQGPHDTAVTPGDIVSTVAIKKPVNCVLAGQQRYKASGQDYEIFPRHERHIPSTPRSRVVRLKDAIPSFTIKTDHRGY